MTTVAFIGTFDPLHGGHIGQLLRVYHRVNFSKALILIDKNPAHKPGATSWQHRLKIAELTMSACEVPFKYKIIAVESSLASAINEHIDYKITGIDSFVDNISDPSRWKFVTQWPLIILSIPDIQDSVLIDALHSASKKLCDNLQYTYVSENEVPIMNYNFSINDLSIERVHSTHLRSGANTDFIPQITQNYIHAHHVY